jgi:hypothetical protein
LIKEGEHEDYSSYITRTDVAVILIVQMNGYYIKNRSFRGNNKVELSIAKSVISMLTDKKKRSKLSPDVSLTLTMTEPVTVTQYATVERSFGYWEIENFDCYRIGFAAIKNYVLPGGSCEMYADSSAGYRYPSISISHASSESSHILLPSEIAYGITLQGQTIDGGNFKLEIPNENLTEGIDERLPRLSVRNDSLVVDGTTVMSSEVTEWEGSDIEKDYLVQIREAGLG